MSLIIADHVNELSSTTGTSPFSLSGAADLASIRFSSKCSVGDTCFYSAIAVDGSGVPTGEWENGLGTYSSADTLTRTQVLSSSNSGSAVSFSSGIKHVCITMPAAQVAWVRERLSSDRTYYVRTDGNNNNTGLANTSIGAFLTIQKAVDTICNSLSLNGFSVTVQIADGTYTTPVVLKPLPDNGSVTIQGNSSTPSNVLVSTTNADCFLGIGAGSKYMVKDLKVSTTTSGGCLHAQAFAEIQYSGLDFGSCAGDHIYANTGSIIWCKGSYTISGSSGKHFISDFFGLILCYSTTITLTGTPAFSGSFAYTASGNIYAGGNTYSGSATGKKYDANQNGVIAGVSNFPGSVSGTTATGGQVS